MSGAPVHQPLDSNSQEERLDSWKDIAAYLKRSVPTVQRWEKDEGLPVHRLLHKKQGSVYAFKSELDTWFQNRRATGAVIEEEIEQVPEPISVTAPAAGRTRTTKRVWILLAIGLLVVAAFVLLQSRPKANETGHRVMIAVLPFQNLGGGASQEYVCDGMTEELITELAALDPKRLGIIARTSAMVYKSGGRSVREIGKELGVEYVVEGSILFAEGKSRVTVQLIRVADQSHLWAHTYDGKIDNLLEVEQEISRAVADEVNVSVTRSAQKPNLRKSSDPEAYRLYVEGRQDWYKRSQVDLEKSIELFDEAIRRDQKFAAAYAAMADSYNQMGYLGFRPLGVMIPKAQEAAQRALELDPQSADAHAALGFINAMWLWEWKVAENHYQQAMELDPSYVPAHHYYALFLASAGRLKEAQDQMQIALKLDPLAPAVNTGEAYILYFDHQYERSIEFAQKALQRDPQFAVAHALLGWDYVQSKRYDEGIAELKRSLELSPDNQLYLGTLGRAYVLDGQSAESEQILRRLDDLSKQRWVSATARAMVYAAKDDRSATMEWLGAALKQEDGLLLWLKVTPEFDSLRDDPRFKSFLAKSGLPNDIQ